MKSLVFYSVLVAAATALFLGAPGLDLWASGLFFDPGHGFIGARWEPALFLSDLIPRIAWGILVLVVFAAAWLYLVQRPLWRFDRKALVFIVAAVAIGPGFLANTVLKDHWGRARPAQVTEFGGPQLFTPAPLPAGQCPSNCSFVSGHAALAFSLVTFALLLPAGSGRRRAIAAALAFGALIGLDRIAEGRHFLSDVVFAGILVTGTTSLLHWWIVRIDGLAAPRLLGFYRWGGRSCNLGFGHLRKIAAKPGGGVALAGAATAAGVVVSADTIDRPAALYFHAVGPGVHLFFGEISRLGLGWGWLAGFALAFAALHWGGLLPRLRRLAPAMRAWSAVPAFLFAAIAASGLVVDVLKVIIGRTRPKLLFAAHLYGFDGLALRADHWSFPSGHTSTIVALAAALAILWPRHVLFYAMLAAVVAASRVIVGAHYPSDILAGAFIAIVMTRAVAAQMARAGIDLAAARRGLPGPAAPWPCHRLGRLREQAPERAAAE